MNGKEKKSKNNKTKDDVADVQEAQEENILMTKWKHIQRQCEKSKHEEKEQKKNFHEKEKNHLKETNMPVSEKRPRVNMNDESSQPPEIYQYDSVFQEGNDNAQQKLNVLHEEHTG